MFPEFRTAPTRNQPLAVFLHLQKTGGQTLRYILRHVYDRDTLLTLNRDALADLRRGNRALRGDRSRTRAMIGHLTFAEVADIDPGARFVTMMREPVQRVLSDYSYATRHPETRVGGLLDSITLEQFARSDTIGSVVHNLQTRVLGQRDPRSPVSTESLVRAKSNLERFALVGLTERFDESVLLMRRALGWQRWPFYERRNTNPDPQRVAELPDGVVADIAERNQFDTELYRWAAERFGESVADAGARFPLEVAVFEHLNSRGGERLRTTVSTSRTHVRRAVRRLGRAVVGR